MDIWAYCLMPNHIHLIGVPSEKDNLILAIGEAHRRYARRINSREAGRGISGRAVLHRTYWMRPIY